MTKAAQDYFNLNDILWTLVGSRSKGGFVKDSDWDYFVPDLQFVIQHLKTDGWTELEVLKYQDASTSKVFEKVFGEDKVQVSLRKNFKEMSLAWRQVPSDFYVRFLNKRSPDYIGKDGVRLFMDTMYYITVALE